MADGKGCQCNAYGPSECGCDADWTPQELIDARAVIALLRLTDAEREAVDNAAAAMQAAADELGLSQADCERMAATLRGLLDRTQTVEK